MDSQLFPTDLYVLTLVPCCLDHYCSVVSFETSNFLRLCWLFLVTCLCFHVNFRISLSISAEKEVGIVKGMAVTMIASGSIAILTILSLLIHRHDTSPFI